MTTIVLSESGARRITGEDIGDAWQIVESIENGSPGTANEWFSISAFRLEKAWLKKLTEGV